MKTLITNVEKVVREFLPSNMLRGFDNVKKNTHLEQLETNFSGAVAIGNNVYFSQHIDENAF